MSQIYDVAIIGSGIGGLTCGALLARFGMKVLVLEKHIRIGGYADSFKRRKYTFEVGIHSVPMAKDGFIMYILEMLGLREDIETVEISSMYAVETPNFSLSIPSNSSDIDHFLKTTFPSEISNINLFKKDMSTFYDNIVMPAFSFSDSDSTTIENLDFVNKYHNRSYADYINEIFTDDKLKALLLGQWPYSGIAPANGANIFHIMTYLMHYFEGSHFCKGGFSTLATALSSVITSNGGDVLTSHEVSSITVADGKAQAIVCKKGNTFEVNQVVSNISPYLLHNELLPQKHRGKRWQRRLKNLSPATSSVILYLGMKKPPDDLLKDNFTFWFESENYTQIAGRYLNNTKEHIDHLIFLKGADEHEHYTLTLMNFVLQSYSNNWKSDKMRICDMMLDKAEELRPGLRDLIDIIEVGSPDTFERYTNNSAGSIYGFENIKTIYGEAKMPAITHLPNLFQTGHWGKPGCGVWNTMFNAFATTKTVLAKSGHNIKDII